MQEKEGRLWPTEQDTEPLSVRYWVQRINASEEYDGFSNVVLTEDSAAVERRLSDQFKLYRVAQAAKRAIISWAEGYAA